MSADRACRVRVHVQVWYSAAWTVETQADFVSAVAEVLREDAEEPEVRVWLQAWRGAPVPLRDARREWLDRQVGDNPETLQLNLETDWRAMTRYRLTGEILGGSVGSAVFFTRPRQPTLRPEFTAPEDFWFPMAPEALAAQRLRGGTFVAAAIAIARSRVAALRSALDAGAVTLQVRRRRGCTGAACRTSERHHAAGRNAERSQHTRMHESHQRVIPAYLLNWACRAVCSLCERT